MVEDLKIEIEPTASSTILFDICKRLIVEAPDRGNTPQKISFLLLSTFHESLQDDVNVTGDDRASTTSTTSKKPGDINEELSDGSIYKVYEITVKPFDSARIDDSLKCLHAYAEIGEPVHEVIVICRPEDCPREMEKINSSLSLGYYDREDVRYIFWNIFEWLRFMLERINGEARKKFHSLLNAYVNDINTSEKVKKLWMHLN